MDASHASVPPSGPEEDETPRRSHRWVGWLLGSFALAVVVIAAAAGGFWLGAQGTADLPEIGAGTGPTADAYPEELEPVIETYERLRDEAVDPPPTEDLVEGAVDGMLEVLDDPYARYYLPADYDRFSDTLDGTYSGVGMELQETPDGLFVVTVFEGTPAEEVGIASGDQIIAVDGEDVRDEPIEAVVDLIRGEPETEVTLGLERNGEELEVSPVRAEIEIPLLEHELLDDQVGYIRLNQFISGAGEAVRAAADDLLSAGAEGLVLDLRGNPGGLLPEAVGVASVFVDDGPVVIVEAGDESETFEASGGAIDAPLVVLVDGGSASASEIVAGAVRDTSRGQVVGETTFGKGTVQAIRSLSDGSGLKFTNARYLTPAGDSIEEVGVEPDRVVEAAEDPDGPDDDPQLSAAREELRQLIAEAR